LSGSNKGYGDLIEGLRGRTVLVVGDLMLDRYLWGAVSRISPEAPVPVVHVGRESEMAGGAANVARNIVSLGGCVRLIGAVGTDAAGRRLKALLEEDGVDTEGVISLSDRPTTSKTRVIAHHQQVVRFDREEIKPLHATAVKKLRRAVASAVGDVDAVVVSDYAKGVVSAGLVADIVSGAGRRPVIADPKVDHFRYYRGVSVVTPNVLEAARASGIAIVDEATLVRAARRLMERFGPKSVLVTRGEDGMTLVRRRGRPFHVRAAPREVFDVTGAGDTVAAVFVLARAAGLTPEAATEIANTAGGVVVGELGTSVIRPDRLLAALDGN